MKNFNSLPDKLIGLPGAYISECWIGKDFDFVNMEEVIEYDGHPRWNRLQELEIERRASALDCKYITWAEGKRAMMKFIKK